jgi:hypothetical protein
VPELLTVLLSASSYENQMPDPSDPLITPELVTVTCEQCPTVRPLAKAPPPASVPKLVTTLLDPS